jgi:hypothetical protein
MSTIVRTRGRSVKSAWTRTISSPAACFQRPVRSLSFHPTRTKVQSQRMPASPLKRPQQVECARLVLCARNYCRRQFSLCGRCDHGRRYCGTECARAARRDGLRRAGSAYQRTDRGRRLHADRQARYRARLREVTHQSRPRLRKPPPVAAPQVAPGGPVVPTVAAPCPSSGTLSGHQAQAITCLICVQRHVFHRVGLRGRPRRRARALPGFRGHSPTNSAGQPAVGSSAAAPSPSEVAQGNLPEMSS